MSKPPSSWPGWRARLGETGVALKDESDTTLLAPPSGAALKGA
jgi:hypothetical protein